MGKRKTTAKNKQASPYVLPLCIMLAVVPLIIRYHDFNSGLEQFAWYAKEGTVGDVFLYYKSVAIVLLAVLMCALLLMRLKTNPSSRKPGKSFLPLLAYAVLTVLSTLVSPYRYFSFHGASEMYETLWVLLGYCVMAFYAYQCTCSEEDVAYIMKWLTGGLCVMLAMGVLQACGHDIFLTDFGKGLITGNFNSQDQVSLIFEKGRAFMTLYNPNYVASYFALMGPVEIALFINSKALRSRVLYGSMLAASLVCLLASGNRSGIAAFAVTGVFALVLLYRHVLKAWKLILPAVIAAVGIAAIFLIGNSYILEKFARFFEPPVWEGNAISEIQTGEDRVAITYRGETFCVAYNVDGEEYIQISLFDGTGQEISRSFQQEENLYIVQDSRFEGFTVKAGTIDGDVALLVHADGLDWCFKKGDDGSYYYYNKFGKWDKINRAPRVATGFLEGRFEERGTIWSKTLPMLKNNLLLGTGADTYTVTYPQDDYVDKAYKGTQTQIDVKPHCFYLQVATQSGIPALIAVLVFYLWYFIKSVRLYRKAAFEDGLEIIGAGLLLATFTYMVTAVLNDSTVVVAPVFWVMTGMGTAVNRMVACGKGLAPRGRAK